MTDKKAERRAVALPRLHKSIEDFANANSVKLDDTVGTLLDKVQAAWFEEAKK